MNVSKTLRDRELHSWVVGFLGALFGLLLLFSGSLYALVFTGQRWLGAVTPLGGVAFLVGWFALAWGFLKDRPGGFNVHDQ